MLTTIALCGAITLALLALVSLGIGLVRFWRAAEMFEISRAAFGEEWALQYGGARKSGKAFVRKGICWTLVAVLAGAAAYVLFFKVGLPPTLSLSSNV